MNYRYSKAFKLPRRIAKYILSMMYYLVIRIWPLPKVRSIDETLDKLIKDKCSISRFGDGEFLYIIDKLDLPFQVYDQRPADKMKDVLKTTDNRLLVGLPIGYHSLHNLNKASKLTWRSQIAWIYPRLHKCLDLTKTYYNASMTRPYADYEDKSYSRGYFEKLMKIWEGRDVLLIEGEKSRLGVGNDLFSKTKSIQRILAPKHHAFSKYNELISEACKHDISKLILIALGPTATAMTYDMAKIGYQSIDIGNVDIEYEWFLKNAFSKEKIPGKYTSEAKGGREVSDIFDINYESQITARIL
jgi:glycosyltransferase family protein